jgi:hypothetical protein
MDLDFALECYCYGKIELLSLRANGKLLVTNNMSGCGHQIRKIRAVKMTTQPTHLGIYPDPRGPWAP